MTKGGTIFYVDNDYEDLHVFGKACRELGYDVALFDAPEKMIFSLDRRIPSVLFVDLSLPHSSGYEITAELKSHKKYKNIPIVAYSDTNAKASIERVVGLGADLFIKKPMTYEQIRNAIRDAFTSLKIDRRKT